MGYGSMNGQTDKVDGDDSDSEDRSVGRIRRGGINGNRRRVAGDSGVGDGHVYTVLQGALAEQIRLMVRLTVLNREMLRLREENRRLSSRIAGMVDVEEEEEDKSGDVTASGGDRGT